MLGHNPFLPNPLQLIIHCHRTVLLYVVRVTGSVAKISHKQLSPYSHACVHENHNAVTV
jgi:hypothetical protein